MVPDAVTISDGHESAVHVGRVEGHIADVVSHVMVCVPDIV